MYPLRTRVSNTDSAPFRFWIQPQSTISYNTGTPAQSGVIHIKNAQIGYSSTFLCYFKEYNSLSNLFQGT